LRWRRLLLLAVLPAPRQVLPVVTAMLMAHMNRLYHWLTTLPLLFESA
jgi:hypothetical protein